MEETRQQLLPAKKKRVVVLVKVELMAEVREDFSASDIEFYYNESSVCASNVIDDLARQETNLDAVEMCHCNHMEVLYQREATEEDYNNFAWKEVS